MKILRILNFIALIATITINGLANTLPINGMLTGEVSDSFLALFTPAGYVFAIWGLIYLALTAFAVYQILPSQKENSRIERIGIWFILANLFNIEQIVKNSLLARSISIPFALILTEKIDGSISLIPLFTVFTGLVGMLFGDLFLIWMRYQHRIAHGAAFGNAAHAMGIARAQQRHSEEGVVASLSMIISGIIMVLFAPPVIALIKMLS